MSTEFRSFVTTLLISLVTLTVVGCSAEAPTSSIDRTARPSFELLAYTEAERSSAWLTVSLPKGWHIYWKNPGDSGLPTRVSFSVNGVPADEIAFPVPSSFPMPSEMKGIGYDGAPSFLGLFSKESAPVGSELQAKISWLLCSDELCIPGSEEIKTQFRRDIPAERLKSLGEQAFPTLLPSGLCSSQTLKSGVEIACKLPLTQHSLPKDGLSWFFYSPQRVEAELVSFERGEQTLSLKLRVPNSAATPNKQFDYEVLMGSSKEQRFFDLRGRHSESWAKAKLSASQLRGDSS